MLVQKYFKKDKISWINDNDGEKVWDKQKVSVFWKLLRQIVMSKGKKKKLYDFEGFIFPDAENTFAYQYNNKVKTPINFWHDTTACVFDSVVYFDNVVFQGTIFFIDVEFTEEVSFKGAEFNQIFLLNSNFSKNVDFSSAKFKERFRINIDFQGEVSFEEVIFQKKVEFEKVDFKKGVSFDFAKFLGETSFNESIFSKKTIFSNATFSKNTYFIENIFKKSVEFNLTNFISYVHFFKSTFKGSINFDKTKFKEKIFFERPIFEKEVTFSFIDFNNITFSDINKYWDHKIYGYINPPNLYFQNVFFRENVVFQNTNFTNLQLKNCDVTNAVFSRCEWNDKRNRLTLKEDRPSDSLEKESKIIHLLDCENHYRQLKRNFDNTKNWELSGKAYVSEMEMRKQRLFIENKYFLWLIYWFYGFFGGYTQHIGKPFLYLSLSIPFFSFFYLWIDHESWCLLNISKSFQKSFDTAIPFFSNATEYELWYLVYFQKLFCGTLVAFFIFALRKRFKQ